jgi:hypothetical protein
MKTLPQVLEIIFQVQRKMSNEKITRREINFQLTKQVFFPFFFLWTPPTFKPHYFLISYSFKAILNAIGTPHEFLQIIFDL